MPKLTKTLVDNTQPGAVDVWVWDSELEGFGLRVKPTGRKTYVVRYRTRGDRTQRKHTLGRCTDFPPEKARELARKVFTQVAEGGDPANQRRIETASPTVRDLMLRYQNEHAGPFKKARSGELDEKNWRIHILPVLGDKRVAEVTRAQVLVLHGNLSYKPATANQCLALLSKAFNLAEDWELRPRNTNPCHRIKKYDLPERELILSPAQIKRLNGVLEQLVREREIARPVADLVRLLMVTGCRLREIMHARREWVDRDRSLLLLPDSKTGQRRIPLSGAAMAIIEAMPPAEDWLIPGRVKGEKLINPYKPWAIIKRRAGLPGELRLHDLRHTAGSLGHMAGLSQKQIAEMLGHKQLSTTERYLHGVVGDRAAVAEKMGQVIVGAWAGSRAA